MPAVSAPALRPGHAVQPALPSPPSYMPPAQHPVEPMEPRSNPLERFDDHTRPPAVDPKSSDGDSSELTGRLPRRVRQRSLAPQLRKRPEPAVAGEPVDDFEEPSPELSRDLMSSLQSGWLRGRDTDDENGEPGTRDEWGES